MGCADCAGFKVRARAGAGATTPPSRCARRVGHPLSSTVPESRQQRAVAGYQSTLAGSGGSVHI
jgi:hypothetical protein